MTERQARRLIWEHLAAHLRDVDPVTLFDIQRTPTPTEDQRYSRAIDAVLERLFNHIRKY